MSKSRFNVRVASRINDMNKSSGSLDSPTHGKIFSRPKSVTSVSPSSWSDCLAMIQSRVPTPNYPSSKQHSLEIQSKITFIKMVSIGD